MITKPPWETPRLRYVVIGVAVATLLFEIPLIAFGFLTTGLDQRQPGILLLGIVLSAAFLCGPALVAGLPVAAVLRAVARRSPIANATGFAAVVMVVPAVAAFGEAPLRFSIWYALPYAVFDAIALAIAIVLDRRKARRAVAPDLASTFE